MNASPVREWLRANGPLAPHLLESREFALTLAERMSATGAADEMAYRAILQSSAEEYARLHCRVAVPETWLFRYHASFEFLRQWISARRRMRDEGDRADRRLRILSAPCAGGAEAFAAAATAAAAGWPLDAIDLDAVDLDAGLARQVVSGACPKRLLRAPLPAWAQPWFETTDDTILLHPALLARVRAWHGDVLDPRGWAPIEPPVSAGSETATRAPLHAYDVILCRNLIIYFSAPARERLAAWLTKVLAPRGLLLLGHADPVPEIASRFAMLDPGAFAFAARPDGCDLGGTTRASGVAGVTRDGSMSPRMTWRSSNERDRSGAPGDAEPGSTRLSRRDRNEPLIPLTSAGAKPVPPSHRRDQDADGVPMTESAAMAPPPPSRPVAPSVVELWIQAEQAMRSNPVEAERLLRRIVYLDPMHEAALLAMSELARRQGRIAEADRLRDRAFRAHLAVHESAGEAPPDGGRS